MTGDLFEAVPAQQPKVDPETLVLRGSPRRAVRFRRGVIVAAAAVAATMVVGTAWFALKPSVLHFVAGGGDVRVVPARASSDILASAPKTYGDVPRLGPPLPGDLGQPILEHLQAGQAASYPANADQAAQTAEAEAQRVSQQRRAAREAGVMVKLGASPRNEADIASAASSGSTGSTASRADEQATSKVALDPDHDPNAQQRKSDFVASTAKDGIVNPHVLTPPVSPYTLSAGTVIAASLITGLRSDLPGMVIAQVTENTYDTATGRYLLLPQGARLIGTYDSVVAYGQKRALVVWQRIILPDGSSIQIDNEPAADTAGYAGLSDKVDAHTWQLLKGVALSSLLGVGTQLSIDDNGSDLVRAIRESTQQSVAHAGDEIVGHSLNVQPTITVRPGWPLVVVVHKDIVLRPWRGVER